VLIRNIIKAIAYGIIANSLPKSKKAIVEKTKEKTDIKKKENLQRKINIITPYFILKPNLSLYLALN